MIIGFLAIPFYKHGQMKKSLATESSKLSFLSSIQDLGKFKQNLFLPQ